MSTTETTVEFELAIEEFDSALSQGGVLEYRARRKLIAETRALARALVARIERAEARLKALEGDPS